MRSWRLQQLGRQLLQKALDPPRSRQARQVRREVVDEVPDLVDHRLANGWGEEDKSHGEFPEIS